MQGRRGEIVPDFASLIRAMLATHSMSSPLNGGTTVPTFEAGLPGIIGP